MRFWFMVLTAALAFAEVACNPFRSQGDCRCECVCPSAGPTSGATQAVAPPTAAVSPAAPAKAPVAAAPVPIPTDRVIVGVVAAMTGDQASHGEAIEKGVKLALEDQNRKGGIKGKQVAMKIADSQSKDDGAAAAATQLTVQERVTVMIGETASGRSLAMAPIADANQVPMISPTSTNPKVTKDGAKTRPYVFRVCFIDSFQGAAMARFAREVLKVYQVAVMRDTSLTYSTDMADLFSAKFKELGGSIVVDQSYKTGDKDFKAQLQVIKSKRPEAIFLPGYHPEVPLVARQARELGITVPFLGAHGWNNPKLFEVAQGGLNNSYFTNMFSDQDPSPVVQDFVRRYKSVYGAAPDPRAVMAYDAAIVALAAMERAKDLSGPAIRESLEQTKGFQAVSGTITIDAEHNPSKSTVVLVVDNNTTYYSATITP